MNHLSHVLTPYHMKVGLYGIKWITNYKHSTIGDERHIAQTLRKVSLHQPH